MQPEPYPMGMNSTQGITGRRLERAAILLGEIEPAVERGMPADHALASLFARNRQFGGTDRRFYSSMIFAWFRWKGLWRGMRPENPLQALALAYWLDGNELDDVLLSLLPAGLPPVPQGGVEEKLSLVRPFFPGLPERTSADLFPQWVLAACDNTQRAHAAEFRRCFVEFAQTRPPTWLRLGSGQGQEVLAALQQALPDLHVHPLLPRAVATRERFHLPTLCKQTGAVLEIQDLASQVVGHLCRPAANQSWWDMCAGGGGKTLHLADLMQARGRIVATDTRTSVLRNLLTRAKLAGVASCIQTATVDDVASGQRDFDGILVDAPCSGVGTWGRNPDARWRIQEAALAKYARTQAGLLELAASRLKPGGRLVYSVCTFSREETLGVVKAFSSRHPGFHLESMVHPLHPELVPLGGLFWVWPWAGPCNGMFVACFVRASEAAKHPQSEKPS